MLNYDSTRQKQNRNLKKDYNNLKIKNKRPKYWNRLEFKQNGIREYSVPI